MMNDEVENGRIIGIGDVFDFDFFFLLVLLLKDTWPSRRLFLVSVEDSAGTADQVASSHHRFYD